MPAGLHWKITSVPNAPFMFVFTQKLSNLLSHVTTCLRYLLNSILASVNKVDVILLAALSYTKINPHKIFYHVHGRMIDACGSIGTGRGAPHEHALK